MRQNLLLDNGSTPDSSLSTRNTRKRISSNRCCGYEHVTSR
ncbi:Protein of unknown function [Pyronema omphalodes CBS 100304]|uniref:Uncharacterized protein n=1 Tax=Pyronema omphalodes (strain CBS 100304) TaxID=1076935 RepID=U4L872_PYROM|nr:Protein of unknown function [Pyronema omphalodes CBS 100304]